MNLILIVIGLCVMAASWACLALIPQHRLEGWLARTLGVVCAYGLAVTVGGVISALWEAVR